MIKIIETEGFPNFDWKNKVVPWHLVKEPYVRYETANCTGKHRSLRKTFLNCANGFDPDKPVSFIKTKKGTDLLVNSSQDHNIALITIKSNVFKGEFQILGSDVKILEKNEYTSIHCAANISLAMEYLKDDSFLYVEVGDGRYNHQYLFITWDRVEYYDGGTISDAINKFFLPKEFQDLCVLCTPDEVKELTSILNPLHEKYGGDLSIRIVTKNIKWYAPSESPYGNLTLWFFWKGRFLFYKNLANPFYVLSGQEVTEELLKIIDYELNKRLPCPSVVM